MKAILIGPVYPYKGGISHYTGLMHRALSEKHQAKMISYKMQYPRFLFKKEQRDYDNDKFKVNNTNYLIHTANPFNWIVSAIKLRKEKADVIIIQWWHPYFAPCYYALGKLLGKTKILFICHNVFPHERFPLDKFLVKSTLRQGDCYIVHSRQDEQDLLSIKAQAKYAVAHHPTYNAFKMTDLSMTQARAELDIESAAPVILFFGFIREYKGLKYLLKALPMIKESLPDIQLWVVGDFHEDRQEYSDLIEQLKIMPLIRLVEGYVPDRDVEKYFAATDLVVLPYVSATQSGIVQIAYGFEKPVVVTDVGGLPDVVDDGKTGFVVESGNSEQIAEAVVRYFTEGRHDEFRLNIRAKAGEFSWERMAERIEGLI
jgi:glycosyltransferase involved in cell wall biosynthesis